MKLSILICHVENRGPYFLTRLLKQLKEQAEDKPVEILVENDNGERTIGEKRNALLRRAKGEYIAFVDDDDLVSAHYVELILSAIEKKPDVIGMNLIMTTDGYKRERSEHALRYKTWWDEPGKHPGYRHYFRNPNHLNPVKRELALQVGFPSQNMCEDRVYSANLLPLLQTEVYLENPIYYYLFRTNKNSCPERKVISFSLYGDDPKYCAGAIKNVELARKFYPDWCPRFYVDRSVPSKYLRELEDINAEVVLMKDEHATSGKGMFWRFQVADDPTVDRFIVRDVDSRIGNREAVAVNDWIQSGKSLHIMRDHPMHGVPIMGGLWGGVAGILPDVKKKIADWPVNIDYVRGQDQFFLKAHIWSSSIASGDYYAHDEEFTDLGETVKWPKNATGEGLGGVYNADQ